MGQQNYHEETSIGALSQYSAHSAQMLTLAECRLTDAHLSHLVVTGLFSIKEENSVHTSAALHDSTHPHTLVAELGDVVTEQDGGACCTVGGVPAGY